MGRLVSILTLVLAGAAWLPIGAQAAFGLEEFDVSFTDGVGSPAMQAGSHPFAFTTSMKMNMSGSEVQGRLQELLIDEMPGLLVDPTAVPRCSDEDFETLNEGINDCSDVTAVGILEAASGEPEDWTTAPVFNLVPPSGALMRLGFPIAGANVTVDFKLSPEPPYRLLATVGEIPETIELFGARLQLWGVPASPSHDALRGGCAVKGGSCPAWVQQRPLLTLPTSCEGPQATFYEALSWQGDEDLGSVLTHSGPGNPTGFSGCHQLGFDPFLSAKPTTEAAQTPTGLDVSVAFVDESLASPGGNAESQVRDLALTFPGGISAGPSLTSVSGSCTEADLEAETPAAVPGEGCPETSDIGTAEAESPLVGGESMEGAVYRASPHENFAADAATAFYVVLRNPDRGVVIAQPVGLEADPETGELIAIAEEMPQLPFSRLDLHLDEGALISPTRCDKYMAKAYFETWSGEGPFVFGSPFPIGSGPNGGPCPTGDPGSQPEQTAGSSPAPGAVAASTESGGPHPASSKRRCVRGKHSIRRHGKTRCVKKRHSKHQKHRWHLR